MNVATNLAELINKTTNPRPETALHMACFCLNQLVSGSSNLFVQGVPRSGPYPFPGQPINSGKAAFFLNNHFLTCIVLHSNWPSFMQVWHRADPGELDESVMLAVWMRCPACLWNYFELLLSMQVFFKKGPLSLCYSPCRRQLLDVSWGGDGVSYNTHGSFAGFTVSSTDVWTKEQPARPRSPQSGIKPVFF